MTFQYASDLHIEFKENRWWLENNPMKPVAPILLLAGDISTFKKGKVKYSDYFQWLSEHWEQVYIIPGNHEFYGSGSTNRALHYELEVFPNVNYLNNKSLVFHDTEIFFSTLWSHCSSFLVEERIADFFHCRWGSNKYTFQHHNQLHKDSIKWLDQAVMNSNADKKVVVTHFVPCLSVDGYPALMDGASLLLKEYFTARMDEYIKRWKVDYWIYGHNHWNNDVMYEGTQFLSNMLGYCSTGEQERFIPDKVLNV